MTVKKVGKNNKGGVERISADVEAWFRCQLARPALTAITFGRANGSAYEIDIHAWKPTASLWGDVRRMTRSTMRMAALRADRLACDAVNFWLKAWGAGVSNTLLGLFRFTLPGRVLRLGDIVRLKSGGKLMTVTKLYGQQFAEVTWFNGRGLRGKAAAMPLPLAALVTITPKL